MLGELQDELFAAVMSGVTMPGLFVDGPVPIEQALRIHRATISGGLRRVLALAYPTVEILVGPDCFTAFADDYAQLGASVDPTMAEYAAGFANFIAASEMLDTLPYVSDVARLDRLVESRQWTTRGLLALALDDSVVLEIPRSLALLDLTYPAAEIRAAVFDDDDAALGAVDCTPTDRAVAVWRSSRSVSVAAIAPQAARFLKGLMNGITAEEAFATASIDADATALLELVGRDVFASSFARVSTISKEETRP